MAPLSPAPPQALHSPHHSLAAAPTPSLFVRSVSTSVGCFILDYTSFFKRVEAISGFLMEQKEEWSEGGALRDATHVMETGNGG